MKLVPTNKPDRIGFFETHIPTWMTNATAIGSTSAAVTDVQTKTEAARTAFAAQLVAQAAAKTAVQACDEAIDAMLNAGMVVIEQVRTKARTAGDGVYTLAGLPAPAIPSPIGELGKPSDFVATLSERGEVTVAWKCTNPVGATGTVYQVWRQADAGELTYIGGTGAKEFIDTTIPQGTTNLVYQVQAVRSTSVGPWSLFNVNFGAPSGTLATTMKPVKIAA